VHDEATGSGIVAIAAALAGAADVTATDLDPAAVAAAHRNAVANGVNLGTDGSRAEVLVAGDVFYSPVVAPAMIDHLRAARRRGVSVLVGDPGRGYFPERLFEQVTEYVVPVPRALEDVETLPTGVWRMR
jgi:predicted nicotinamide N-methyase